ncbi:putative anion transporter 3 chloroplastic [Prunus yedoensis var. nudiflora]|uniref:Putative anion transporter 3 chloroplastic n=1 Tax=Prunus yedoensis var. nudiflora TaxID=2094558 RepID=A0A314Z3L3_PRUYE|nr:putative anion transporter 3 chloroplastic [Prunus yedoensis var. nudiflora]
MAANHPQPALARFGPSFFDWRKVWPCPLMSNPLSQTPRIYASIHQNLGNFWPTSILLSSIGLLWLDEFGHHNSSQNDHKRELLLRANGLRLIQAAKIRFSVNKWPRDLPTFCGFLLIKIHQHGTIILANITNNWHGLPYRDTLFYSRGCLFILRLYLRVNLKQAAWFSAVPWGTMAVSSYIAGAASDSLIKAGYSLTLVRKIMQSIGFIGPGVSLLCLNYANTPTDAAVLLTAALCFSSFSQAGFLLNMQDIAPQYAGFLHGISNSAGTFAAIVSTIGTGYFVQWLGSFQAFLTVTAALYFVTAIFWNLFATGERVF